MRRPLAYHLRPTKPNRIKANRGCSRILTSPFLTVPIYYQTNCKTLQLLTLATDREDGGRTLYTYDQALENITGIVQLARNELGLPARLRAHTTMNETKANE